MSATAPSMPGAGVRGRRGRPHPSALLRSLVRGGSEDPAWVRPVLLAVLALAAALCV